MKSLLRIAIVSGLLPLIPSVMAAAQQEDLLAGHPRPSYEDVKDIDEMEEALRKSLAGRERYSFSRGWWQWDRLRAGYVDGGRKDKNALRILRAVFRGLILDRHARLQAKGEGDLLYIFFTSLRSGKREEVLEIDGRKLYRDVHGGGAHGGWGGAARMRIYEELVRRNSLTQEEMDRFKKIVHQSFDLRLVDFQKTWQAATNHAFGNAGGIAIALRLFPDVPQADEARAWLERIWKDFSDFGDWKEWNYHPYGPIFLHGMLDIAEATGKMETERELIKAIGRRALGFVHSGGVRGNPNAGCPVRKEKAAIYADPWNVGYYETEQSARDGHFWYRMAKHFKDPQFLWAAEQVTLGGRPPNGKVPGEYTDAYNQRFAWFVEQGIQPLRPARRASVGYLSELKHRIPERLYLLSGNEPGQPFASFFLYEKKDEHLDNISGHLYEYAVNGAKFLHTSGKYNNVYDRDNNLRGGGTGEESLDLMLVMKRSRQFPLHPDRFGDERDFMRRGSIKQIAGLLKVDRNSAGDSYGQFAFDNYYGSGSLWKRRVVLTSKGYLVVFDEYVGGKALGSDYQGGPVWHLARQDNQNDGPQRENWFDAPALDYAWWQKVKFRVLLYMHDDGRTSFGSKQQSNSQDIYPNVTTFGCRPVTAQRPERFLSVLVPYGPETSVKQLAKSIETTIDDDGNARARIGTTRVSIQADGNWAVSAVSIPGRERSTDRETSVGHQAEIAAAVKFADTVLKHGRDRYGEKKTPLFVDGLNVETMKPPARIPSWSGGEGMKPWISSNLADQGNMMRFLVGLSNLTGEPKYKRAAISAVKYNFDHFQGPGGMLPMGHHRFIELKRDEFHGDVGKGGCPHELKGNFLDYRLFWETDPVATRRLVEGIWNAHVRNWSNLEFNRHAGYDMELPEDPWGRTFDERNRSGIQSGSRLSFYDTAADMILAAGMLSRLSGDEKPLVWAERLLGRYVHSAHPKTGLIPYQHTQSGNRPGRQSFPANATEPTMLIAYANANIRPPDVMFAHGATAMMRLGEALGERGEFFRRSVYKYLTAYARNAYDAGSNTFRPMLCDGTDLTGFVIRKDGYFGSRGTVLTPWKAHTGYLLSFSLCYRQSKAIEIWRTLRAMARGSDLGDIGTDATANPKLNLQTTQEDPQAVFALIELFRATRNRTYLDLAHAVAGNMLKKRFVDDRGLFVLDKNHLIANLDSLEPLALITLVAADRGELDKVPTYDGGGHYAWGRTSVLSGHSVPVPGVTSFEVLRPDPGTFGRWLDTSTCPARTCLRFGWPGSTAGCLTFRSTEPVRVECLQPATLL